MFVVFFSFLQRCKKSFDSYVEHFPVINEEDHRLISSPTETDEVEIEEERVSDAPATTNNAEESDRSASDDESHTTLVRRRRRDRLKGIRKFFSGLCSCFRRRPP